MKPWNRCIWGHNFYHVSLFYFSWLIKFFLTIAFWKSLVPEAPQDFWCCNTYLPYIPRDCFKSYENFFPMLDFFPTSCIYLNPLLHQKVNLNVKNCILHTGLPTWQNFRFDSFLPQALSKIGNECFWDLSTYLNSQTSVCTFSILFFIHILKCWQGEFVWQTRVSWLHDYFIYSHEFYVWVSSDTVGRNYMCITLRSQRVKRHLGDLIPFSSRISSEFPEYSMGVITGFFL